LSEGWLSSITLGVRDLDVGTTFYSDGLGFVASDFEGVDHEIGHARFFLLGGIRLGLWPLSSMRSDTGMEFAAEAAPAVYGLAFPTAEAVNATFGRAVRFGGSANVAPRPNFWGGYSGYVSDPDGHVWELVHDTGVLSL
jgi:uncharacterized glyoxalase superfamily protein PhnB